MSTCCECTPSYTWLFGSDEISLRRTSTPIPAGESRSRETFSSSTDELFYQSWMDGLVPGNKHRRVRNNFEGDTLEWLWDDSTPTTINTGSELHPADHAGPAPAATSTKLENVLAPILPATGRAESPGSEKFPVPVIPTEYAAVDPGAVVFRNLPDNNLIAADYANCPPGMNLVPAPSFLPIGASVAPIPTSMGMNLPTIPAPATSVPVPIGVNYAIAPGCVNFAAPAPVPIGVNLVVGSSCIAVNLAPNYDLYSAGLGNFSPYQVLIQPLYTPSCNTTLYCNFFLGCNPDGTCCSQPKTRFNGYA